MTFPELSSLIKKHRAAISASASINNAHAQRLIDAYARAELDPSSRNIDECHSFFSVWLHVESSRVD